MAVRYAVATGNWSAVGTWDGGASLPTVGDDVYANGYTVTVDQDITVAKISTEVCPTTSVGGGQFSYYTGITVVANIVAGTSNCLVAIANTPLIVIGNVYGSVGPFYGIITKQVYQTDVYQLTITGNVYFNGIGNSSPINSTWVFIYIIGNVYSSSNGTVISRFDNAQMFLYLTVIGGVYANVNSIAVGYSGWTLNELVVVGIVQCLSGISAFSTFNKKITITGSVINYGGKMALLSPEIYFTPTGTSSWTFQDTLGVDKILYTADVLENPPAENDVRSGVVYGIGDAYEGTCAVPPAESVALNVPVDDTVGELVTTPADFIEALKADDLGKRMGKCATTEEVDSTVAAYNS